MATTGTFSERIAELRRMTGCPERIVATCEVNQAYAHFQSERLDLHHPRGGHAKYLEAPLFTRYQRYLRDYARTVLKDGGQRAMIRAAEDLSDEVEFHAPREWGDLRKSGHPQVHQGMREIYDRPPKVARLTEQELRAKSRAILRQRLAEGLSVYFMKNGKVLRIPGKHEPHEKRGRL